MAYASSRDKAASVKRPMPSKGGSKKPGGGYKKVMKDFYKSSPKGDDKQGAKLKAQFKKNKLGSKVGNDKKVSIKSKAKGQKPANAGYQKTKADYGKADYKAALRKGGADFRPKNPRPTAKGPKPAGIGKQKEKAKKRLSAEGTKLKRAFKRSVASATKTKRAAKRKSASDTQATRAGKNMRAKAAQAKRTQKQRAATRAQAKRIQTQRAAKRTQRKRAAKK